jgi:hypothetical protein
MNKPFGWGWRSPWWNIQNGEEITALLMMLSFFGVLYFLWKGIIHHSVFGRTINLISSVLCFLLMVLLGFKDIILS